MHDGRVVPHLTCRGFEPPADCGHRREHRHHHDHGVLPLKARLLDPDHHAVAEGGIPAPPVLRVRYEPETGPAVDVTALACSAGRGHCHSPFSFDYDHRRWHFNLSTRHFQAPGLYRVTMESGDSGHYAISPTCETTFEVE